MGNQPSKDKEGRSSSNGSSTPTGPSLDSYPSFSKSDTKESSRSFRTALRTMPRIPGKSSQDSPRASSTNLAGDASTTSVDKVDSQSIKSTTSGKSSQKPSRSSFGEASHRGSLADADEQQPPPSPTMSSSVGAGHSDMTEAQRSGEVDAISDAPPSGNTHHMAQNKEPPGGPIIVKKSAGESPGTGGSLNIADLPSSLGSMDIGALKTADLDDYIRRLVDAAYSGKVTKTVCLKNAEITAICNASRELFLSQPALLELSPPVKIVGDVHGQYPDLIRMFEMCGWPPDSNYLFLGDYVDRGKQSLETIMLLLCFKLRYPENFFLLRGNHECANVTRVYGFYDECKRRCNVKVWKTFVDTFNTLPIAAIVAGKIFCVHGGLSPSLTHMDDIRNIARPTDVPDYGLLNDLLWSDPSDMDSDWEANERGVSYCFGKKVIMEFLHKHDFDLVCRAHMVVEDGYEFFNERILVTVFSAPNVSCAGFLYC